VSTIILPNDAGFFWRGSGSTVGSWSLQRKESVIVLKNGYRTMLRKAGLILALLMPALSFSSDPLVRPPELEPDIAFWRSIFAEVSTEQALVHDNRYLQVVYARIEVPANLSAAERRRVTAGPIERYANILKTLGNGKRTGLTSEEQRVLGLWPANITNAELREAATRIRVQMGLSDRFLAGLKRSGAWRPHIEKQLAAKGVPAGLIALPHVESSYNNDSHSHVGAAGLWQFMRATAKEFMTVDNVVDERRDPFRSSEAAAQLLAYNYSVLKSWPLAITAYNHGLGGMRRAVREMGTEDIAVINRRYSTPSFGFASRNFYVSFLAALEVEQNAEKYFGPVKLDPPQNDLAIKLPDYVPAAQLAGAFGVSQETLRIHNQALLQPVWDGSRFIPRGFTVRVPAALVNKAEAQVLAALPSSQRFASQKPDAYHTIGRGESLSRIAARYGTTARELASLNGLASQNRIRAGQRLRLPASKAARSAQANTQPSIPETYTVRKGDSLGKIASRTGVSESTLMSRNGLRNKNHIKIGQVLYLRAPEPEPKQAVAVPAPLAIAPASPAATAQAALGTEAVPQVAVITQAQAQYAATASLADPLDYTVAADATIEIQAAETLGLYADWLGLQAQRLRDLNGMSPAAELIVGERIRLEFQYVDKTRFESQRIAHHRKIQEDFFIRYRVTATTEHTLQAGESIWQIAQAKYNVPVWLLRQYNPDLDFGRVKPGMSIIIPQLQPITRGADNRNSRLSAS